MGKVRMWMKIRACDAQTVFRCREKRLLWERVVLTISNDNFWSRLLQQSSALRTLMMMFLKAIMLSDSDQLGCTWPKNDDRRKRVYLKRGTRTPETQQPRRWRKRQIKERTTLKDRKK